MCFFQQPQLPQQVATPSVNNEEARRRRAQQTAANEQQSGRAATVLTSPLGDPNFGQNINRTVLVGV
ncbi:MAG TPA: hypothetical protein VN155_16960 [Devosia sp.]|nr:hypothetical protein [Devosia sp.]